MEQTDRLASERESLPVSQLSVFIRESVFRITQWVAFARNDEHLWEQIRLDVGLFMHTLFLQGAFQGPTPEEAYFVKCDETTNTANDIESGVVTLLIGFAPLKPAEFFVLTIRQTRGAKDAT